MKAGRKKSPVLQFYQDLKGEWRWRFIASNGRIIAESGEGYKRLSGALEGFNSLVSVADYKTKVIDVYGRIRTQAKWNSILEQMYHRGYRDVEVQKCENWNDPVGHVK